MFLKQNEKSRKWQNILLSSTLINNIVYFADRALHLKFELAFLTTFNQTLIFSITVLNIVREHKHSRDSPFFLSRKYSLSEQVSFSSNLRKVPEEFPIFTIQSEKSTTTPKLPRRDKSCCLAISCWNFFTRPILGELRVIDQKDTCSKDCKPRNAEKKNHHSE